MGPFQPEGPIFYLLNETPMKQVFQNITVNLATNLVRHDTMQGQDYFVAPAVLIVEGVLNGNQGPLLYPADELRKYPGAWDHKPVVVYHPELNGCGISACNSDILTTRGVGVLLNTHFESGKKGRLKSEVWIKKSRIDIVDNRIRESLESNKMMELSTGLALECEPTSGEFDGVSYDAIARNFHPDHLALLPDKTGACSIADGAGLVRNELSFQTIKDNLGTLVSATIPKDEFAYIEDVFDDLFIFERSSKLYRQNYEVKDEVVKISGVPEEVVRRYEYVTVNGKPNRNVYYDGVKAMDKKKVINDLIANKVWAEEDRAFLEAQNEDGLKHLQDRKVIEPEKKEVIVEKKEEKKPDEVVVVNVEPLTTEQFIANAPSELRESLQHGQTVLAKVRASMIDTIIANKQNKQTKEVLAAKSIDDLQALVDLCPPTAVANDYSGLGSVQTGHTEEALPLPKMTFGENK